MTSAVTAAFTTGAVTSRDGTRIGYRATGHGPGVVLIHGGGATSQSLIVLARLLSGSFSVYLPDRRGRGLSRPAEPGGGLREEVEDLDALLQATGAERVFGLSAGAVVALAGAVHLPALTQLALFEPPLFVRGFSPTAWAPRYQRELTQGRLAAAFVTIIKGTEGMRVPRFLLVPRIARMLRETDARARQLGFQPMSELIPEMRRDIRLVEDGRDLLGLCRGLRCSLLLLGGAKSPRYLQAALDALSATLPAARWVTLARVGHTAANNAGKPELVASELRRFFG